MFIHVIEELVANDSIENNSDTEIIDVSKLNHPCSRNSDGSLGGMELDGLLLLMKQKPKKHRGEVFLEYVVIDDNTQIKKYISHPKYKPNGKNNIGGSLPDNISVPKQYVDPTRRSKSVAGAFLELTKEKKTEIQAHKLDVFCMKKYYSYYIKQNCSKGIV